MTTPRIPLADINILDIGTQIQMAGAIYSNDKQAYLVMFPDEHDSADKPMVAIAMTQADWIRFNQQTDYLEVEMHAPDADGKIVKSIVRKSQRQIDQGVSWLVYKRASFRCEYCGGEAGVGGMALTVDHLVLFEEGGPAIPENLAACCRRCNKTRGNMKYRDWLRSPYYKKVSQGLIMFQVELNEKRVETLPFIPRQKIKSR